MILLKWLIPVLLGGLTGKAAAEGSFPLIDKLCKEKDSDSVAVFTDDVLFLTAWPNAVRVKFDCQSRQLFVIHRSVTEEHANGDLDVVTTLAYGPRYVDMRMPSTLRMTLKLKNLPSPVNVDGIGVLSLTLNANYSIEPYIRDGLVEFDRLGVVKARVIREVKVGGRSLRVVRQKNLLRPDQLVFKNTYDLYEPDFTGLGAQAALEFDPFVVMAGQRPANQKPEAIARLYREMGESNRRGGSRIETIDESGPNPNGGCSEVVDPDRS